MDDLFSKAYWNHRRFNDPLWMRAVYVFMAVLNTVYIVGSLVFLSFTFAFFFLLPFALSYGWMAWPTLVNKANDDKTRNT